MKTFRSLALLLTALCSFSLLGVPRAAAQDEIPDSPQGLQLGELVNFSIQLMQKKQWKKALEFNQEAINSEGGEGALKTWGPLFGTIWYRKGLCEYQLEQWDAAAKSFEQCYKNFPNKDGAMNENQFEKMALFYWAKSEMGREEWQKAIDLFQKFLNELELPRDNFNRGDFFISRATCFYKLRKIIPGNQDLEAAMQNKLTFQIQDAAILAAFREMAEACIELGNEQALVDFIRKNRGGILTTDDDLFPHAGVLMKLANEAREAEMKRAAVLLYQMLPSTERAIGLTRFKLKNIGKLGGVRSPISGVIYAKDQLKVRQEQLEKEHDSPTSLAMVQLAHIAFMHEIEGNLRGAYAAYRQLELHYPHAEKREDNLFNLARTSFLVGGAANGLADAKKFLAEYPDSKHAPFIKRLMFQSLFAEQRYEECIESASEMLPQLTPGTPDHDICLHVLGGSYYYTGQYEKAAPLLQQHVEQYPDSDSKVAAAYFHASNPFRMNDFDTAAERLDGFLENFSDPAENPFLAFALMDRASCHYQNEENEKVVELTTRIITDFKEAGVVDDAHNLRGNAHVAMENIPDAERDFKAGFEIAERWGDEVIAAEALYLLADLMITEGDQNKDVERLKESLPFLKTFWEKFGVDSPYRRQVAILQIPALKEDGRLNEALERLAGIIAELAKDPEQIGALERTLPAYTEAYLEEHTPEQLRQHYFSFDGIRLEDKEARALIYVELIKTFDDAAKAKNINEDQRMAALATVKNLFNQLKLEFDVKELAASILIRVGDYLRQTSTPREALAFYNEVLERGEEKYRFDALMGRAYIYAQAPPGASDLEKALADFRLVHEETEKDDQKEMTLYGMIQVLVKMQKHGEAIAQANAFLDQPYSKIRKAKVMLLLGDSYEKSKKIDDAMRTYMLLYAQYKGTIEASAPAVERYMRILWQRNKPGTDKVMGDRQGAYELGHNYIKLTERFRDQMRSEDLELWLEVEKLVRTYEANPNIKPIKAEEEDD